MNDAALDRVKLIFTLFDVRGAGYLEADDFDLMANRVVAASPRSTEAAKGAIRDAFRRYWTTLASELDSNNDGRITFEEYCACVLSPERFDDALEDFAEALAELGDPDGDGLIHRTDFMALMTAIGFKRRNVDTLFDAFGPTPDDQVKVPVWAEGIKEYYSPEKAEIVGDLLVEEPDN
ncbi:EF-hand domain-containing protein [Nonomuraea spiralis]|uniref:EF-hand domain-containing protein n=1 Tax=Nonomuraea spiralis TaxID=46182 RepID=A0ABV5INY6_9ACTN|nr:MULTISPECIES: EF-hand domain-containing protein [Nonomuraea]RSM99117.1 calcium-binding protein [Nonomuraea sp. WAC 01424]GGT00320.1 calcium-binding protein [Nonomuraea spiralis]